MSIITDSEHAEMIEWFLNGVWYYDKKHLSDQDKEHIKDLWEDWKKYELNTDKIDADRILITGPSRIMGLLYLPKMVNNLDTEWQSYTIKKPKIKNGEYGHFYYEKYVFSTAYIISILDNYFKDKMSVDLKVYQYNDTTVLAFRVSNNYAIGIAEKKHADEFNDIGVHVATTEVVEENGEIEFKVVDTEYLLWDGWKAIQVDNWKGRDIKYFHYHKSYIFEKMEDEGDFLLL